MNTKQPSPNLKIIYLVTGILSITAALPTDLFVACLPTLSRLMSINNHVVQLAITIFVLGFAIAQFIYGPLSDYFGRKKIIMTALSIGIVGGIICAVSHSIDTFIAGRFLQGIGASGSLTIPRAIFRDISSGSAMSRAISFLSAIVETVIAISPMMGGFLVQYWHWQSIFGILIFVNMMALLSVIFLLPETNLYVKSQIIKPFRVLQEYKSCFNRSFVFYVLCGSAGFTNLMLYFTLSPFVLQNGFRVSPAMYGMLTVMISGALITGAVINTRCVTRMGIDKMLSIASFLSISAGLLLAISVVFFHVTIFSFMVYGVISILSCAFFFPNGTAGALHQANNNAGLMSALYGGLQIGMSFLVMHTLVEWISIPTIEKLSIDSILMGFIPLVFALWKRHNERKKRPEDMLNYPAAY